LPPLKLLRTALTSPRILYVVVRQDPTQVSCELPLSAIQGIFPICFFFIGLPPRLRSVGRRLTGPSQVFEGRWGVGGELGI